MARTLKLYKVGTAAVASGENIENYSSHNVLAKDAQDAIRKAHKRFTRGEYAEEVSIIGHVDD